jgi:apolipoprotein N-acyltransferase
VYEARFEIIRASAVTPTAIVNPSLDTPAIIEYTRGALAENVPFDATETPTIDPGPGMVTNCVHVVAEEVLAM